MKEINADSHATHSAAQRHHAERLEQNLVRSMTGEDGSLALTESKQADGKKGRDVLWAVGEREVLLEGWFTAANLRAIADHMEMTPSPTPGGEGS